MDFSLDDILSEYRVWPETPAAEAEPVPPAQPLAMSPEPDGVSTARVDSQPLQAELMEAFRNEEALPASETPRPAPAEPEEQPPRRRSGRKRSRLPDPRALLEQAAGKKKKRPAPRTRPLDLPPAPAGEAPPEEDTPIMPAVEEPEVIQPAWPAPDTEADRTITEEELLSQMFSPEDDMAPLVPPDGAPVADEEYTDEADFYAGPAPEAEEPADTGEDGGAASDDSGEEDEDHPAVSRRARRGGEKLSASRGGILDRLSGLLSAAGRRRDRNRAAPAPEPEDLSAEMPPEKAARHYASQIPALRLRTFGTAMICLLLIWLTVSCRFGAGLPGRLATDIRLASMVALVAQITVLLLGLDVITAGVMSIFRGRPGAEALIVTAMLASTLDILSVMLTHNGDRGFPFVVLPCLSVLFALWGGWQTGAAYHDSFLALFHAPEGSVVTTEELPERRGRAVIKSSRSAAGFIRRSEEPSLAETLAESAFLPMMALSAALALAVALGSRDPGAFFHLLGLYTALCASFGWLFSFPLLYAGTARHLLLQGSAIAGWSGVRDAGTSRCLVVTDTDVFPTDTVEITGIRLLDKSRAREIIALTGSMLSAAGTGNAPVFTELMRRYNAALLTVEDLSIGEGGCKGTIDGKEIRAGTVGYMHLSGVKIPDKLRKETAVYLAEDGALCGVFLLRYRPMASVQRALWSLRKERRKPIFAVRDFCLDPQLLRAQFGVSTEGFEFPPFTERYRISSVPLESRSAPSGILAEDGLETLVDLTESGRRLYSLGTGCAWLCPAGAALGALFLLGRCWAGNWAAVSAFGVMLYMLALLIPTLICRLLIRK